MDTSFNNFVMKDFPVTRDSKTHKKMEMKRGLGWQLPCCENLGLEFSGGFEAKGSLKVKRSLRLLRSFIYHINVQSTRDTIIRSGQVGWLDDSRLP